MNDPTTAITSEQAVLAAALWSVDAFREADRELSDGDWYRPQHADLWRIMRDLDAAGVKPDASAVMAEAVKLSTDHGRVVTSLATSALGSGSIGYHCQQIIDAATDREITRTLQKAWQRHQDHAEPVALAEDTIAELRVVQGMRVSDVTEVDVLDLISKPRRFTDFVIPGLLARANRIILTAPEGYGKSTLLRQIAGCAAGGLHPFRPEGIRPVKVLVIDAENPEEINQDEYRKLLEHLDVAGCMPKPGHLVIEQCGPVDLLDAREAAKRVAQVERIQPELILIGPIYQLHEENPNDEGPARKLSAVLDRMRAVCGSALVTEAHTPHSDGPHGQLMRPFGASLWKRWPEFGYCLHPSPEQKAPGEEGHIARMMRDSMLSPWRGPRAKREWPTRLTMGARLPWEASW